VSVPQEPEASDTPSTVGAALSQTRELNRPIRRWREVGEGMRCVKADWAALSRVAVCCVGLCPSTLGVSGWECLATASGS